MIEPDFLTFKRLAREGNLIPVTLQLPADTWTPVSAFLRLARPGSPAFLLESVEGGEKIARYSFMGTRPFQRLRYREGHVELTRGGERQVYQENLFRVLRRLTRSYEPVTWPGLPPFVSGAVGYFAYDAVRLLEPRLAERQGTTRDDLALPDADLSFFSELLVFDHIRHQIRLIANVFLDSRRPLEQHYRAAIRKLKQMADALERPLRHSKSLRRHAGSFSVRSNFAKPDYLAAVRRAKQYIRSGDIYQVVLSQRFEGPIHAEPFSIYRGLRRVNPSPYMYFLDLGDAQLVGASPEMLVKVQGRSAFYRPIAGTRRRGESEEADQRLEHQLRQSAKERAEHVMLVDLGRNDLGRVCEYGSVKVEELMTVERYSHVMHLVSSLCGRLRRGADCFEALAACFPAGTVSGAPKVRAMEIIDELEPARRGVYAGCVCYMDFSGNLDSCIAIRTLVVKNGVAYAQAGGGIVADSHPEREYQETVNKARALLAAIELAETGDW
jgi:anthranilate synthase component 1